MDISTLPGNEDNDDQMKYHNNNNYGGKTQKPGPSYQLKHHKVHYSTCQKCEKYEFIQLQINEKKKQHHPFSKRDVRKLKRKVIETPCTCKASIASSSCSNHGKCKYDLNTYKTKHRYYINLTLINLYNIYTHTYLLHNNDNNINNIQVQKNVDVYGKQQVHGVIQDQYIL